MKTPRTSALIFTAPAALCLAFAAFGAQALELRGFRGVHWGEGVEALRDAGAPQVDGDVACYQRDRENLIFGDTPLNGVRYCFHHDRLVMVMLDAPVAREVFSAEFQRAYGGAASSTPRAELWGGAPAMSQAELVAQGQQAARLTIMVSRIEPDAARRMHKLAAVDTARERVATDH
jgi:hypothetical protein